MVDWGKGLASIKQRNRQTNWVFTATFSVLLENRWQSSNPNLSEAAAENMQFAGAKTQAAYKRILTLDQILAWTFDYQQGNHSTRSGSSPVPC